MKKKQKYEPTQLAAHLYQKSLDNGHSLRELAAELKISYVYLMKLLRTPDTFSHADRRIFEAAARYLDFPVVQCYLLGDALKSDDFMVTQNSKLAVAESLINSMRTDPTWCGFVPTAQEIKNLDEKSKMLMALLYQKYLATELVVQPS